MKFGNENARVSMEDDRISNLPDEIIHHILSFNGTKYAVQTSVLSSRWKLIWTTLPYLNFSTDEFRILNKFSKFVKRVLTRRVNRIDVSRLDLYVRGPANSKFVKEKKLGLYKQYKQLPLCFLNFFSSQSLKHLSIKTNGPEHYLFTLPKSPWDFPALTAIELTNIQLRADNTRCLDLFSKCARLKNLTLSNCHLRGFKVVKIMCPRLVCLTISCCHPSEYEILAPDLSSFTYVGFPPQFLSTGGGLHSLEKVKLHTTTMNPRDKEAAHRAMDMLSRVCSSRGVILDGSFIALLTKVLDLVEHQPSPYSNLMFLKVVGVVTLQKLTRLDLISKVTNY